MGVLCEGDIMIFGYARVSTQDQNLDRQIDQLDAVGCQKIFSEKYTGTKRERPEFNRMLDQLRSGDIVIVSDLSRISRSSKELLSIVEELQRRDVQIKSLKEAWLDTTTTHGKLIFTVMAGLAQFERDLTSDRTKEGLASARARNRIGGRPAANKESIELAKKMYFSKNFSVNEILKAAKISRVTLYRYLHKDPNYKM